MKFTAKTIIKTAAAKVSRKNRLLLLTVGGGLLVAGTVMATAPRHDPNVAQENAWPVSTLVARPQEISPQLQLFGRVETPNHAHLTAAVTATVTTVNVVEGEAVRAGDVLLTLDDTDELTLLREREADLRDAQAVLTTVQHELQADLVVLKHMRELHKLNQSKAQRLSKLKQRNLVATEQLEDTDQKVARQAIELAQQELKVDNHPAQLAIAQASVQRAQARFDKQDLALGRTLILAPFDGRISRIETATGDRVMEGSQLVSLYDTAGLRIRAAIPSAQAVVLKQSLRNGQAVTAVLEQGGVEIPLQLDQLAAEVSRGRSGIDGLFTVSAAAGLLELGRAVDLTLDLPAVAAVGIPVQSVYGENRIYTVADDRLQAIDVVSVGQRRDAAGNLLVLVRAPELMAGTPVLTTSLPKASTGLKVEVINDELLSGNATQSSVDRMM